MNALAASYHSELCARYEVAEEASQDARREAERARDYYDGRQLDEKQIAALKRRKQPIVIENLIRPKVDYLCGLERQSRTDPKAYPRTMAHEDDASAATDALRYVADDQDYPVKRSQVFQQMLVEGFGGIEVYAEQTRNGIDPALKLIDWDRMFYDPHSSRSDFSDAMYLGYVTWMDASEAKRRWQDKADVIDATMNVGSGNTGETFEDKPRWQNWADTRRRRVRIVTIYDRTRGVWERGVFTKAGLLEDMAPSPFLDEDGQPECALILQSAYVDRENDRYGLVRDYITLQDEVNKRRSKFLHLSNSRTLRVSTAVAQSPDEVRKEMSRPDGVFIGEAGDVEDLTNYNMASGHFSLLAEAKEAIKAVGPNATMQGKSGQDQSGRAILALQQGGMTEIAPLMDALRHFNIRVYRAIWNRIRQFWTGERWVRVTDDESNVRFVGLNVTQGAQAALKVRQALKAGEVDEPTAMQFMEQIAMDPAMQQPANAVAELDVDIEIDEAVDTPTLQIEQFEQLTKLAPMAPPQYMPTMFEMLIEASNLRNKDKLRKIAQQASQPDPSMQMAQEMQMRSGVAQIENTEADTAKKLAEAEATQAGAAIDAVKAGMGVAA